MKFTCPQCSATLRGGAEVLGHRVKCVKCGQRFRAEANGEALAAAASPVTACVAPEIQLPDMPSGTVELSALTDSFPAVAPPNNIGVPANPPAPNGSRTPMPVAAPCMPPTGILEPTKAPFRPPTGILEPRSAHPTPPPTGITGAIPVPFASAAPVLVSSPRAPAKQPNILIRSIAAGVLLLVICGGMGIYFAMGGGGSNSQAKLKTATEKGADLGKDQETLPSDGDRLPDDKSKRDSGNKDDGTKDAAKAEPTTPGTKAPPETKKGEEPKKVEAPGTKPAETEKPSAKPPAPGPLPEPKLPHPVKKGADEYHTVLSPANQDRVNAAIEKGVQYLKKMQLAQGTWMGNHPVGYAALPALTLLECGVPPDDPVIQRAAAYVRMNSAKLNGTYELSLAILFFDKLGDPIDKNRIHNLAARLIAGQQHDGGWTYTCRLLNYNEEAQLVAYLQATKPEPFIVTGKAGNPLIPIGKEMIDQYQFFVPGSKGPMTIVPVGTKPPDKQGDKNPGVLLPFPDHDPAKGLVPPGEKPGVNPIQPGAKPPGPVEAIFKPFDTKKLLPSLQKLPITQITPGLKIMRKGKLAKFGPSDNSNTQFAIMALWVARKYHVPVEKTMALVDQRFLSSQNADGGWSYHMVGDTTPPMNCVGLIGLAVGHGSYKESLGEAWKIANAKAVKDDPSIQRGIGSLGRFVGQPPTDWSKFTPQGNLYFMWSVERVAMLYNLKEIGGKDWYSWAAHMLIVNQQAAGNWTHGQYHQASPTIDTCLALLILRRANFVPDLTESLKEYIPIRN